MADIVSVNVANAQSLHNAVVNVLARQATERPANTQRQYMNKQKEFREWCASKGFCDGELVNKRSKQADGSPQALGFESIDAYVKAIVDMYQQQKSLGMNKELHPRGVALRALVDLLKRSEVTRKREAYADRGLGTVLNGYNVEDMKALSSFWLSQQSGVALRDRVDFLLGHALLAQGESRRFIQFPDLLTLSLSDEGPQHCTPLVVIMTKGKTNQHERVEYGAAMRCKKVLLCPMNAVSMYLFWRWHVDLEPFPVLTNRKAWYGIHLLKGKDSKVQLSYNAQLDGIKRAFESCGIDSSVWTHSNRVSAAKIAESNGADEAQIRRAGRWNSERMEGCYLTTIPRKAMRSLAGFPTKGGSYWLARGCVTPCDELQRMVYRDLEKAEADFEKRETREIAAGGFIGMLHDLRVIFLQDSVLLRRQFRDHPIWQDPLFLSPEYRAFENEVIAKVPSAEALQDKTLESAIPLVATALKAGFESVHGKLDSLTSEVSNLKKLVPLLGSKKLVLTIVDEVEQKPHEQPPAPRQHVDKYASAAKGKLRLSRSLRTIPEVWCEYAIGLGGQISVREAEKRFGPKWRADSTENRFFSRRKVYYDAIKLCASENNMSYEEAAEAMESKRVLSGKSLNAFSKMVKSLV
ncbi:Short-chain dehydrogenase, partial [Globisporangium splendens]